MASADDSGFLSRWARRKALARQGVAAEEPALMAAVTSPAVALPAGGQATVLTAPVAGASVKTESRQATDAPAAEPHALAGEPVPPGPTLEDAQALTTESDFSRFVRPDVSSEVKNAALKTLFTDPHFNVMDGLDIYIDDYNKFEPITPSMLRMMTQSKALNLFDDEPGPAPSPALDTAREAAPETAPNIASETASGTLPESGLDPAAAPAETSATTDRPAPDEDPDLRLQPDDAAGPDGPGPGPGEDAGRQP
jgi:hypothetical protein